METFLRSGGDVNERKGDGSTGLVGLSNIFNSLSKIYFKRLTYADILPRRDHDLPLSNSNDLMRESLKGCSSNQTIDL